MNRNVIRVATVLTSLIFTVPALTQTDRVTLTLKGSWPGFPRGTAMGVAVSDEYVYVCSQGLQAIEISDPVNPRPVGALTNDIRASHLAVSGNYVYMVGEGGFQVIDVFSQTDPHRVGACNTSGDALGVAVAGNHVYLADGWAGLQVIDISNSAHPKRVGGYYPKGDARSVAVSGDYAYVADGDLEVLDITAPAHPRRVGGYEFNFGGPALHVVVSGDYALVTYESWFDGTNDQWGGLQILDVSNPASPRRLGGDTGVGTARGVAVSGNYAYVAFDGKYSDVGSFRGHLEVIDISNPDSPSELGRCETMKLFGVVVSGSFAYVVGGGFDDREMTGLWIIDVSNPANLRTVGFCDAGGAFMGVEVMGVSVSGNYAYVCGQGQGLQVIDVSNPTDPRRVGGDAGCATATAAVRQGKNFVAGHEDGLLIYEALPFIKSVSKEGHYLNIAWEGFGPARLQRATSLVPPNWQELIGSENTNAVSLPIWGGPEFFRLVKP